MNKFLQFLLVSFFALLGMYIFSAIMGFFSISLQYYIVYLLFALCMGLLFYVLPSEHANIFV